MTKYFVAICHLNVLWGTLGHLRDKLPQDGAEIKLNCPISIGGEGFKSHMNFEAKPTERTEKLSSDSNLAYLGVYFGRSMEFVPRSWARNAVS